MGDEPTEFSAGADGWRVVDGAPQAWFAAPTHAAGAALAGRIAAVTEPPGEAPDLDLRADGVRVRLRPSPGDGDAGQRLARAVSAAARDLGLSADPTVLQQMRLVVQTADRAAVQPFWQHVLGFAAGGDGTLVDPWRRDPAVVLGELQQPRPLRSRIHVDVVRPATAVQAARESVRGQPHGPFGVRLADPDGNEIDLLPGDPLTTQPGADDWQAVFGAMAFYPTTPAQSVQLAAEVAGLADEAGVPLLIDLRGDGVTIDSGKDQWEDDGTGSGDRFVALARRVQTTARSIGLTAEPGRARFVQWGIDAVDIPAVRTFWLGTLGYRPDPREHVTDIYDPRRLNPEIIFQQMDASEDDRRRQRNRLHLEMAVPRDDLPARVDAALAAGGRIDAETPGGCALSDPEGNEVTITAG